MKYAPSSYNEQDDWWNQQFGNKDYIGACWGMLGPAAVGFVLVFESQRYGR